MLGLVLTLMMDVSLGNFNLLMITKLKNANKALTQALFQDPNTIISPPIFALKFIELRREQFCVSEIEKKLYEGYLYCQPNR